ncbi:MAG: tetratricopeptide repeat protein [Pirellulaceae bacterium]|nr:tetratricopeptide repeat protein [Pirellulaceae bacterium]
MMLTLLTAPLLAKRKQSPPPTRSSRQNSSRNPAAAQPAAASLPPSVADRSFQRHDLWHYAAIMLVALLLRGIHFFELRNELPFATLITDSRVYDNWAQDIAAGNWMGSEVFYQSPLYPYAMAAVYSLTGYNPMHVRWLQAFLGAAACGLLAVAGHSFIGRRAGLAAGWMLAVYAPAIFFDSLVQKSSLDLFFLTAALAIMGQMLRKPHWPWTIALGVALGLLALNRENARLLLPIVGGWLWIYFSTASWQRRAGWLAGMAFGCSLVLLPVGWRNYRVGGEFLLSTSQFGPNFFIGNHAGATGLYQPLVEGRGHTIHERADAVRLAQQAQGRSLTPREVSNYWRNRALEFITGEPVQWLRLMVWKSYLIMHRQELVDSEGIEVYARHSRLLRALSWFNFGLLVPLAVVGAYITRHHWRRLGVLYVSIGILAASVAIFFVFARYRYPLVPIMLLLAGAAVAALPQIISDVRHGGLTRRWAAVLIAALLIAVPLNWPLPQYRDDAIAYANYGKELIDQGDLELAETALRQAIFLEPTVAGPQYNLGRVFDMQGNPQAARHQYEIAVGHNPQHGRAHWQLGRHALASGDIAEALQRLRLASQLAPELETIHSDLGAALLASGAVDQAIAAFRRALEVDPTSANAANNLVWLLATSPEQQLRNTEEALKWAKLLESTGEPMYLDTVAAAYAQAGQFEQAVQIAQRGSSLARESGQDELASRFQERLHLYQAGQPYREHAAVVSER